jgi:hypothetical protein
MIPPFTLSMISSRRLTCANAKAVFLATLLLMPACAGEIDTGNGPGGAGDPDGPGSGGAPGFVGNQPPNAACAGPVAGPASTRRLTRLEYANTVRDLLGVTDSPSKDFLPDQRSLGFDNIASVQTVSRLQVEQYENAARMLAAQAVQNMSKLLACDPVGAQAALGEQGCARKFIADFGRRAYRRPLTQVERDRLFTLYSAQRARYGFDMAIAQVVAALLQSPHFLYRPELGMVGPGGIAKPTPHEMASRLSYLVWASMPDDTLLAAADAGRLATPQELGAEVERMLANEKARPALAHFHEQWLGLEQLDTLSKDTTVYKTFTPELLELMKRETILFLEDLVLKGDGRIETMFGATYTFANAKLAAFYGASGAPGTAFAKVTLPSRQRAGLLTHAGLLAAHADSYQSSPIKRGVFVREGLLCQPLAPPPNNLNTAPPPAKAGQTTRERFKALTASETCRSCHVLIDPVGFGLENYDGIGAWRDRDQGLPVDASGELVGTDVDGPYNGALELGQKLARSAAARSCLVTQWFHFASGREATDRDACTLTRLKETLDGKGKDLRRLIVALVQSPMFASPGQGGEP